MTATMYYDNDADPAALAGQTVAIIGYGSQGHAHALNLHESGVDVIVGLAPGSKSRDLAAEAGLRVADVADAVKAADVIMILVPDTSQKARLRRGDRAAPARRPPPDVRARLQHPLRADRPARHRRRRDDRAEGPGPPAPLGLPGGRRRPGPVRRPSRPVRHRARPRPGLRPGDRVDPGGRPRDDLRRGDRDRPVRGAGGPVRRHGGAHQDGLRDPGRGRLPARARLLRDDARAQADRRPDLSRRAQLHALLASATPPSTATTCPARGSSTSTSARR